MNSFRLNVHFAIIISFFSYYLPVCRILSIAQEFSLESILYQRPLSQIVLPLPYYYTTDCSTLPDYLTLAVLLAPKLPNLAS